MFQGGLWKCCLLLILVVIAMFLVRFCTELPIDLKDTNCLFSYEVSTVQITFIFIDFRVCDFAFAFKTQNAPCVSRFKRILFSDRFQFAF